MSGRIVNLYLKAKHGAPMQSASSVTADSGKGLAGDVSYGRNKRQVLFIEKETLDEFGLSPGQVRENVTVAGITLSGLPVGTRVRAGEASFEITGDCAPCQLIEDMKPGLSSDIEGRRGTLCRVLEGGQLRPDDAVTLI